MSGCKVIRTVLITHSTLSLGPGHTPGPERTEWVTRECGTPIFDTAKECMGCRRGWNHPNNYRADGPRPDKEIDRAGF